MNRTALTLVICGFLGSALQAQAPGRTLTAEEVTCDEVQLGKLQRRAVGNTDANSPLFFWRGGPGGGDYRGLAVSFWQRGFGGELVRFEDQLTFDLRLRSALDRLDPSRPLLPQGTLTRRDAATPLLASGDPFVFQVTLDLAPGLVDPYQPLLPLRIRNQIGSEFSRAERAGRGIETDDLAQACHAEVSELDEKIFLLLSRTVRIDGCYPIGCHTGGVKATFFRGREPLHYRINLIFYNNDCDVACSYGQNGPIAIELAFEQNAAGQLTNGTARVLPVCRGDLEDEPPGCTSQNVRAMKVYFLPPLTPGVEHQSSVVLDAAPSLVWSGTNGPDNVTETTIDWAALLANTAWNGGS